MERALALRAPLVGINNRNLHDFSVSLETTARVAKLATPDMTLVSESGIFTRADIDTVKQAGAAAILVGESLMRQADLEAAVRTLLAGQ
jgi:indole-3-glycerol phosphate synthase